MSSLLFDRKIALTFGKPGEESVKVQDLLIQFDIEKSLESDPNQATVQVYNLNRSSRALLQQDGVAALLEAGYRDTIDRLFVGQVKHSAIERQGSDVVAKLEFHDGMQQFQESVISQSFGPGVTEKQVLEKLASAMNVGLGVVKGITADVFQNGISLSGAVRDRLDEITQKMGVEWSIQDNNLQILPKNVPSETLGILLTPDTGLIGSPTEREDSKDGGKFLEFKSLLRVELKPGVAVQIQARDVNGFFKIRKVRYQGDNRVGPFECACEAVEVESGAIILPSSISVDTSGALEVIA